MYLILFLVGIVLAFAGAVLIRYAVPVVDAGAGALFTSGIVAFVGGLILIGLAALVRSLSRIAKRLDTQPLPLPPVAAVNREHPAPRPARAAPAPAAPTRQTLRGWFERAGPPDVVAVGAPQPVPPPSKPRPATKPNGAPETTVYKSGVIDGIAYSLFMDGSIEAELPQGRVKFASIDELQKYLTTRDPPGRGRSPEGLAGRDNATFGGRPRHGRD